MMKDLTSHQMTILALLCEGRTRKDIAECLSLSLKTIDHHISGTDNKRSIERIVGVKGTAQLVRYALENGLCPKNKITIPEFVSADPGINIKTTGDLIQALLKGASDAANGKCNPMQISSLCQCAHAVIEVGKFQLMADQRIRWMQDTKKS